jgi:hypothetical protein
MDKMEIRIDTGRLDIFHAQMEKSLWHWGHLSSVFPDLALTLAV